MAYTKQKDYFIKVSEMIWCDDDILDLSKSAALLYIFLIAYSKANRLDGGISRHAVRMCSGTQEDFEELVKAGRIVLKSDGKYEIVKYGEWQRTSDEIETRSKNAVKGAMVRWGKSEPTSTDPSFEQDAAFEASWAEWPEASENKYREKRTEAYNSFVEQITTTEEFNGFSAALDARLRTYRSDPLPKSEKRRFLGAFKNFCTKWQDWIPKGYSSSPAKEEPKVEPPAKGTYGYQDKWEDLPIPHDATPEELAEFEAMRKGAAVG